jgi:beta-glucuronidase
MRTPENFEGSIHTMDYTRPFQSYRTGWKDLVAMDGRQGESLDGSWHFITDPYDTCLRAGWFREADEPGYPVDYDYDHWPEVTVPSCWNTQKPEWYLYEGSGIYCRNFSYHEQPLGERAFLQFEAVQYKAYVFLNGQCVALHEGGSTPFCVEVTGRLKETNRLIVVASNQRDPHGVPTDNTDWFNYGGIYRDVTLVRTPKTVITGWFVRLERGSGFGAIAVDFTVDGASSGVGRLSIPELSIEAEIPFRYGKAHAVIPARPELWSPESPKLYAVTLSVGEDALRDRIGFREVVVKEGKILLNGEPRFLSGICVHEDTPELGKCTSDEVIRKTISDLKDLHGCFLRLAHYPHSRRFAQIADEMGVLLWEEIPVYWAIDFGRRSTYRNAENQLREVITRDRNRASVIIWSVGNENADTDLRLRFMSDLAATAHQMDDSRLVSAACLVNQKEWAIQDRLEEALDVIGLNEYCGWYVTDFHRLTEILEHSRPDKPVVVTEFGCGARAGLHGPASEKWTEEFQADLFQKQFAVLRSCPYIQGTTPWILYDFRSPRRLNRYQEGYNRKGLVDADHKKRKLAFSVVSEAYRSLS